MTFGKFFGTTLLLGGAATALLTSTLETGQAFGLRWQAKRDTALEARPTPGQFYAAESAVALRLPAQAKTSLVFPAVIFLFGVVLKLSAENRIFRFLVDEQDAHLTALNKTALLLTGRFGLVARVRFACLATGVTTLLAAGFSGLTGAMQFTFLGSAVLLCLAGELIERHLFSVVEVAPKMPGGATA